MNRFRLRLWLPVLLTCMGLLAAPEGAPAQTTTASSGREALPPTIDTPNQSELLPVITADGRRLYFTRTRQDVTGTTQVFDIWYSDIDSTGNFGSAHYIGGPLGSRFGIAVTSVTPDDNTLYLIGKFSDDDPQDAIAYVTHRTAQGWSDPEAIRIPELHRQSSRADYSFGPDGRTLLLSVQRDSSLGGPDLYVSFYNDSTSSYTVPLWLGPTVNSPYQDITPFLAADNRTLYFSSDRPGGLGTVDVYQSMRLDDTWQHWTQPENLGPQINRPGRTTFYTEDARGEYAYFSWRASEQDFSDIFREKVNRPSAVALVHGVVTDDHGAPLLARIYYQRLSDGEVLGIARSNPTNGEYQLTLPAGEDYLVRAERSGYFSVSERFDLTDLKAFESLERKITLTKIVAGASVTLRNIFFETNKSVLLPASYPELDRVRQLLADHPTFRMEIRGYTDSTGTESHNLQLSGGRAEAVRQYLIAKGVSADRLLVRAMGSQAPVATNATEEGRALNRRVEFVLLSSSPAENAK